MKGLFAFLFVMSLPVGAATYYVDFATGSDANNGTATGTPWKHTPGDANATGTAAGTTLVAGDTVNFKGGVTYLGGWTVAVSGSVASPITFDGNSSGAWGTGKAIIDREYVLDASCIAFSASVSNITVNNFRLTHAGGWADDATNVVSAAAGTYTNTSPRAGVGIDLSAGGNKNIILANLLINEIGGWRNTIGWDGATVSGGGIGTRGQSSLTVTNCEITKVGYTGLELAAYPSMTNILVTDCSFHHNINWSIDVNIQSSGGTIDGVTITKCRFENLNQMGGDWQGPNSDAVHQNYIFMRTDDATTPWTNVYVTRCWFGDTNASPAGSGGTGAIFLSKGPSVNIYNNVFHRSWSATGVIPIGYNVAPATQIVRIFNNTFYRGCSGAAITTAADADRNVYVVNNIFVAWAAENINVDQNFDQAPVWQDFNLYYSTVFSESARYIVPYNNLAWIKANTDFEDNGLWGNPQFVDVSGLDVSVATNSPALLMGTNLTSFGITTDYAGNARPSSGQWTIGAYQDAGEGSPPEDPPTPTITTLRAWKLILR